MRKVSIAKCEDYEFKKVKKSIREALEHLGGLSSFIDSGDKVLLKVNLLMKRRPEKVTTTHPSVAQAVAELVIEAGGVPIIGDSPGGYHSYNRNVLESVYNTCGMTEAAKKSGAQLNYNTEMIDADYPDGIVMKRIKTIKPVIEADKIINLPKIKTHMMTVYSGAVKNLFGIIPGGYKPEYHLRFDDIKDFSQLLLDICLYAKPALTIMDAVLGMEGYGPTSGNPRKLGLILASEDPYSLDVIAADIIGFKAEQVPTILRSMERGLVTGRLEDIEVMGERPDNVRVSDFKKPTLKVSMNFYNSMLPKFLNRWINNIVKPKPLFLSNICKGCGVCARSCPPKAIEMKNGRPVLIPDKCIHCFCCHELCAFEAIKIKRPWFVKIFLR